MAFLENDGPWLRPEIEMATENHRAISSSSSVWKTSAHLLVMNAEPEEVNFLADGDRTSRRPHGAADESSETIAIRTRLAY
jgi:hypothetical protein